MRAVADNGEFHSVRLSATGTRQGWGRLGIRGMTGHRTTETI